MADDQLPEWQLDHLTQLAESSRLAGMREALRARFERERPARDLIIVCGCDDWLTCAHPWPMIYAWPENPFH